MSVKSFFESFGSEFKKLFGKAPQLSQEIRSVMLIVGPLVNTGITLADPALEPVMSGVMSTIESDLATVSTVSSQVNVTPGSSAAQTITSALTSVTANLSGLLQVAEVKNSSKIATITAAVNTVTQELQAVMTGLGTPAPAAA